MTGVSRISGDERRFREDISRGAPPRGARQLGAILPNGRTLWLRVPRALAPSASVSQLAETAERLGEWRREHTAIQSEAIDRLAKTVVADAERIQQARLASDAVLRRRMLASQIRLDERLSKARDEIRSKLDRQEKIDLENIRRLRRRQAWDNVLLASSLPLFAAYGDRDSPFGSNNLTLALTLLLFLVGDDVVEALIGSGRASKSPYAIADADAWSYIAPLANLLAGWWLLGGRQHERFVTGVTTVKLHKATYHDPHVFRGSVRLADRIGEDDFPDFEGRKGVPVVATIREVRLAADGKALGLAVDRAAAKVRQGILKLSLGVSPAVPAPPPADLGEVDVAWMVDTRKPPATETGS